MAPAFFTCPSSSKGSLMCNSKCSGAMAFTASNICVSVWHTTTRPCSREAAVISARSLCSSSSAIVPSTSSTKSGQVVTK